MATIYVFGELLDQGKTTEQSKVLRSNQVGIPSYHVSIYRIK